MLNGYGCRKLLELDLMKSLLLVVVDPEILLACSAEVNGDIVLKYLHSHQSLFLLHLIENLFLLKYLLHWRSFSQLNHRRQL